MASETFVSAMMLITAVVASAILITAVFPIVWTMVSTFSSASHETDTRMRTDFKIVTTWANSDPANGGLAKIWLKNIGSNRIGKSEIEKSDVFIGLDTDFGRSGFIGYNTLPTSPYSTPQWTYVLSDMNDYWDIGETMEIDVSSPKFTGKELTVYFQFVLPNGVWRTSQFTTVD